MVGTRRSARGGGEADAAAAEAEELRVHVGSQPPEDSDDEAPEEVSLSRGKQVRERGIA